MLGGNMRIFLADEHFVLRWPKNLPLDSGAPLLCAGIITYSPLRHFGLDKPDMKVGVVGLGGLGHVVVKFAKAFGAEVTVISTTSAKKQEALQGLKADHFIVSKVLNMITRGVKKKRRLRKDVCIFLCVLHQIVQGFK
ncbi:putative mannitol dehydrogenase [Helianthus anomalus]